MLNDCPACEAVECLIQGVCYWCGYDANKPRKAIMPVLQKIEPKHYLFVYGTLKKNFGGKAHERFLQSRPMKGMCAVPGVMVHLGGYPGLVDDPVCQTTGEIYEVDAVDIQAMDAYEGVPHNYSRRLVDSPWGRAWCYFKNNVPNPIPDGLVCVDRGVWQGGETDRAPYSKVKDFYANKRWQEPEFRNMQVQPLTSPKPTTIPAAVAEEVAKTIADANALIQAVKDEKAAALPVVKPSETIEVGLGTEMM